RHYLSRAFLHRVLGRHPLQALGGSARIAPVDAVSRRLPPQQQVLGSPGGLPLARRESPRGVVSIRIRRADGTAAAERGARRARRTQSKTAAWSSNSEEH